MRRKTMIVAAVLVSLGGTAAYASVRSVMYDFRVTTRQAIGLIRGSFSTSKASQVFSDFAAEADSGARSSGGHRRTLFLQFKKQALAEASNVSDKAHFKRSLISLTHRCGQCHNGG
ncbi:MAG: hypothetical protein KGQ28_05350 [Hyphomicrobiales bacterium]|nr:hypothetical protein [Hyphomicrobiales bacterium]